MKQIPESNSSINTKLTKTTAQNSIQCNNDTDPRSPRSCGDLWLVILSRKDEFFLLFRRRLFLLVGSYHGNSRWLASRGSQTTTCQSTLPPTSSALHRLKIITKHHCKHITSVASIQIYYGGPWASCINCKGERPREGAVPSVGIKGALEKFWSFTCKSVHFCARLVDSGPL